MSQRKTVLANNEIYHVFNRGVAAQPTFFSKSDYIKALEILIYYQNRNIPVKYSLFTAQPQNYQEETLAKLKKMHDYHAEIIAYCFMPNHFHLLLKQKSTHGISKFIANFSNSYTKHINMMIKRNGPLFQGKFKAVHIETDAQLLHISRYIHLNPLTSFIVNNFQALRKYKYSSLPEYLGLNNTSFIKNNIIANNFKSRLEYENFICNRADYQQTLNRIKHLILEN